MERETEPKVAAGLQKEGWPGGGAKLKETALQESHGQGVAVRSNAGAYGKSGPQCVYVGRLRGEGAAPAGEGCRESGVLGDRELQLR